VSANDLAALLPLLVLGATTVAGLLSIAIRRRRGLVAGLTVGGLLVALGALLVAGGAAPWQVTPLLRVDRLSIFYSGLLLALSLGVALLSLGQLARSRERTEELYLLLLIATIGGLVLVASNHLASFFLGLETLNVALFALIAYPRTERRAVEAGIKYLILAALSSALLVFGMALLFAATGTLALPELAALLAAGGAPGPWLQIGAGLIFAGVAFKLALVPFHMWTPDVYQGSPAPITAFLATASKTAVFVVTMRFFFELGLARQPALATTLGVIAALSMLAGNLLALLQRSLKRILAYSSIAHFGYLLLALVASGGFALEAATYYLVAYSVTLLAALAVVSALSGPTVEADHLDDYRSLYWRRPGLATVLTGAMLSLAGIPLTAGFIGKFYLVAAGAGAGRWMLLGFLVAGSAIGLFPYLRVVVAMLRAPLEGAELAARPLAGATELVVGVAGLLLFWFGVFPAALQQLIRIAVASLL